MTLKIPYTARGTIGYSLTCSSCGLKERFTSERRPVDWHLPAPESGRGPICPECFALVNLYQDPKC